MNSMLLVSAFWNVFAEVRSWVIERYRMDRVEEEDEAGCGEHLIKEEERA